MKLQIIAAIGMVMFLASASEAKSWRRITPLKSTRADVERLLGQPNGLGRYQFENERAYILYADDECDRFTDCTCLVPKDTVLHIFVTVEEEMKISSLKIDHAKYKMRRSSHLPMFVSYSNESEGIVYTVANDEVTEITYLPSDEDCRKTVARSRKGQ